MTLEVAISHRLGTFALEACFDSSDGLTALFGRSGSGKTSLVNIVAGLVRPDRARIVLAGETLTDTEAGIHLPTHRRRIGYIFQEGRLFPHLTVRQNLLYGRWFARASGPLPALARIVDLLGLGALLQRRPATLSGGEKQRVAIGRALLAAPRLLLMDEPLAALDEARKSEILPYIERLRDEAGLPIVYVSHSIPEVARLATTLVLLSAGQVAAFGPAAEIMSRIDLFPLTGRAEAGAIVEARVDGHDLEFGLTRLRVGAGMLHVPRLDLPLGITTRVRIRARDVMIAVSPPEGLSALNILPGTVSAVANSGGPIIELRLDCGGDALLARLTRRSVEALNLAPGRPVFAVIKSIAFDRHALSLRASPDRGADAEMGDLS